MKSRHLMILSTIAIVMVTGVIIYAWKALTTKVEEVAVAYSIKNDWVVTKVVLNGNNNSRIKSIISKIPGNPITSVSLDEILLQILEHKWIQDVSISRIFPHHIVVNINEKKPFMIWETLRGKKILCDNRGNVIDAEDETNPINDIPLIKSKAIPHSALPLVKAIYQNDQLFKVVVRIEEVNQRRWNLLLKSGTTVKLPEINWDEALKFISTHHKEAIFNKTQTVDMRLSDKIYIDSKTLKPRPITH